MSCKLLSICVQYFNVGVSRCDCFNTADGIHSQSSFKILLMSVRLLREDRKSVV